MKYDKIYLKITTIPNQLEVDLESREIEIFKRKYEAHKPLVSNTDVERAYLNESGVNGSFAKIFSITLGFAHENTPVVKTMYGEEIDILNKLLSVLRQDEFKDATVVMYNRSFILSFLSKRLRVHKQSIANLPVSLQSFDKKAWTIKGSKCIQDYVKGIGYQTENFEETCYIHGIDASILGGSEVVRLIQKEEFDVVHTNNLAYVNALIQVDRELAEETTLGKTHAVIEKIGQVEKEDINVLDHIISSGHLSTPVIEAIVAFTEEHELNKANVLTLVKTAISKTKEYQKVLPEDFADLKDALGLTIDYSTIQCVVDKGNLGKKEAEILIKETAKWKVEDKANIVSLVKQYLTEYNKIGQKRAKESLDFLKEKLT